LFFIEAADAADAPSMVAKSLDVVVLLKLLLDGGGRP